MTTDHNGSLVNGAWITQGNVFKNINPAKPLEIIGDFLTASDTAITDAFAAAERALKSWRQTPAPVRSDYLLKIAERIEVRADRIGHDMALEEGKTYAEAKGEASGSAAQFRFAAAMALQPDGATVQARDQKTALLLSRVEPLGVVVCITPWNFPISIPAWKIAHAIAFGNTVVWKPAELTPLTSIHLAEAIEEAGLPAGVVNMLLGHGSEIGQKVLSDSRIAGLSFTGSNTVGRQLGVAMAQRGIPTQLELGGSNSSIVLSDANLDIASREIANGAYLSAGQKCTATTRVIVESKVCSEIIDRLQVFASTWKVGDPFDSDSVLGPVASRSQFDRLVERLAPIKDFQVVAAKEMNPDNGYFINPRLYKGLDQNNNIFATEIFGPVICVIEAESYEDCLQVANNTEFGLSSSIFTTDMDKALNFSSESESGVVKINKSTTGNEIHVPFGGHKQSGSGTSEMGWAAKEFFTRWKTVYFGK